MIQEEQQFVISAGLSPESSPSSYVNSVFLLPSRTGDGCSIKDSYVQRIYFVFRIP